MHHQDMDVNIFLRDWAIEVLKGCRPYLAKEVYICSAIDSWERNACLSDKLASKKSILTKALIHKALGASVLSLHGWIAMNQGVYLGPKEIANARKEWVNQMILDYQSGSW